MTDQQKEAKLKKLLAQTEARLRLAENHVTYLSNKHSRYLDLIDSLICECPVITDIIERLSQLEIPGD